MKSYTGQGILVMSIVGTLVNISKYNIGPNEISYFIITWDIDF